MQKALLSNKARWSRNRVHPFQAVSHSKQGGKMNGSLCNLCAERKKDCRAHDRKSCFSVPSSECEVQTRSLQEGWLFERVVDHGSFVRLEDLPSTAPEQHIPLEKPVLQAPTPPLIEWLWICKQMVPENRVLISWWDKTPSSSPKCATMTMTMTMTVTQTQRQNQ